MTDSDVRRIEDKVDALAIGFARLEGSLAPTLSKMTERQDEAEKVADDHESRLRALERFRWSVPSLSILSLLVAAGTLLYYLLQGVSR